MNLQDVLSKMNSQMLAQGLKQISQGLSPEQLKQAEAVIKGSGLADKMESVDIAGIQKELQGNPDIINQLKNNPELLAKLEGIVKNK